MKTIATLLMLLSLAALGGCGNSPADDSAYLRIATLPALENFPIFIADMQGFFADEGINVQVENFMSPVERDIAFQADATMDGLTFDLVQLAIYREAGIDLVTIISTIGLASVIGADGVYCVSDLQGRNILSTTNTAMDYIMTRALESVGLVRDDVSVDEVPPLPTRLEMLLAGHGYGAVLPDPFAAMAYQEGLNHLTDTQQLGINPFVFAFRREVFQDRYDDLRAFYRAINRAVDFLNTADREEFIDALIDIVGYPPHVRNTLTVPHFPRYTTPLHSVVQDVLDFADDRGLLTQPQRTSEIIADVSN